MTWAEANQFLIEQVRSRWPTWKPTDMEVQDWCRVLGCYSWDIAKKAIFNYVKDAKRITRRPLIAIFITKAKVLVNQVKMPAKDETFKPEPGKLYGKPARNKAFTLILNGENCKTKRWLIDFLRANPTLIPFGVSLPTTGEAKGLIDDSVGGSKDSVGGVLQNMPVFSGKPNPNWVGEDPPPPDDDIPF